MNSVDLLFAISSEAMAPTFDDPRFMFCEVCCALEDALDRDPNNEALARVLDFALSMSDRIDAGDLGALP
jgi:hypothetical protein